MKKTNVYQLIITFVIILLFTGSGNSAQHDGPVMTLVFTGNSVGYYDSCPTCSEDPMGGLPRRYAFFKELRKAGTEKLFFLSGGWEFLSPADTKHGTSELGVTMANVYGMLGYDAGLIRKNEAAWFKDAGAHIPEHWVVESDEIKTEIVTKGEHEIAVIHLPVLSVENMHPSDDVTEKILAAAKEAKFSKDGKRRLVIAVSPWMPTQEMNFVSNFKPEFDVISGSGMGPGVIGRLVSENRTCWVRPYSNGTSINLIKILKWPGESDKWTKGENIDFQLKVLKTEMPEDETLLHVFKNFPRQKLPY